MSSRFAEALEFGQAGESAIARWLRAKGYTLLPVYEKLLDTGKGPRLFTPSGVVVAPDFLGYCRKRQRVAWIEAKHKTAFSWHRITGRWVTGIDRHHYHEYLKVMEQSAWPVWLLFLHEGGQAKDSPAESPSGLFGNDLGFLSENINHESDNWGRSGMVYWSIDALEKLA